MQFNGVGGKSEKQNRAPQGGWYPTGGLVTHKGVMGVIISANTSAPIQGPLCFIQQVKCPLDGCAGHVIGIFPR